MFVTSVEAVSVNCHAKSTYINVLFLFSFIGLLDVDLGTLVYYIIYTINSK